MPIRTRLNDTLKDAMKAKDSCAVSTIRLILAALKDRDIAARGDGSDNCLQDDQVLQLLQSMVKQRNESIKIYREAKREDLAEREEREIEVIQTFLPAQMDEDAMAAAVTATIGDLGAESLKDMGRTMAVLKEQYAGRMDFSKASGMVKQHLA